MSQSAPSFRSHLTLFLCAILHALTHAFGGILVPLYLLMKADLHLPGVKAVTAIASIYGAVYFLLSYPAGILADRVNRKALLGVGLIGNALAIAMLGMSHQYGVLVCLGVVAGVFGSLFHPTANALVPAHYPRSPGMAVGIMGVGSGLGFFVGSQYAGWRANSVISPWWGMSSWQVPCVELGLVGIAVGLLFLALAREAHHAAASRPRQPMGKGMRRWALLMAAVVGCRDFAGVGMISLVSIYLQKAHGYDTARTGWVIGVIGLVSIITAPAGVWLTGGRRRLGGLAAFMVAGGLLLTAIPHVPVTRLVPLLVLLQVFHLGSYAISEVAIVELVGAAVRGRVIGVYLTVAGTLGGIAPWAMGLWADLLGERARQQGGYVVPFAVLGLIMAAASMGVGLMPRLGRISAEAGSDALPAAAGCAA